MTIRFTKTEKWDDPWFRGLSTDAKVLFLYLCDKCDCAGFWEVDQEAAEFHTKLRGYKGAWKELSKSISVSSDKRFVWLKNFLRHQKNYPLNPKNLAHPAIIRRLTEMCKIFPELKSFVKGGIKGDSSPVGIGKGRGNSKGKGYSDDFMEFWAAYPRKEGKGKAWDAWQKNKPALADCLATLDEYKRTSSWKPDKDGKTFIPHPATWLNQGRWEDEPIAGEKKETLSERFERIEREGRV